MACNFHFALGKSFQHAHMHIHDLAAFPAQRFNVSSTTSQLEGGRGRVSSRSLTLCLLVAAPSAPPVARGILKGGGMYMYYVKVVPTTYDSLQGGVLPE